MLRSFTILLVLGCLIQPVSAEAADASRITHFALLAGGVGVQIAGVYFETQAQESYDAYLHTGRPAEMQRLTDDYDSKHLQSLILSKTGMGMMGLAAFLALMEQIKPVENMELSFQARTVQLSYRLDFRRLLP